jgi:cell division inhibitor SepF
MSRGFNKILDFMKLNDSEYGDDYEEVEDEIDEADDIEEPVKQKKKPAPKKKSRFKKTTSAKLDDDFEDDIDDDVDDVPPVKRRPRSESSTHKTSTFRRNNNIVSLPSVEPHGMEVCVSKPIDFNTCQEISDIILSGRAAIINFDAVTTQEAQRIIDFVSGACYAVNGSARQISNTIVIVTPSNIDITGDLQEMLSSGVDIPDFVYSEEDE